LGSVGCKGRDRNKGNKDVEKINWTLVEEMIKKETSKHCKNENKEEMKNID
jgi:hypothetical protein